MILKYMIKRSDHSKKVIRFTILNKKQYWKKSYLVTIKLQRDFKFRPRRTHDQDCPSSNQKHRSWRVESHVTWCQQFGCIAVKTWLVTYAEAYRDFWLVHRDRLYSTSKRKSWKSHGFWCSFLGNILVITWLFTQTDLNRGFWLVRLYRVHSTSNQHSWKSRDLLVLILGLHFIGRAPYKVCFGNFHWRREIEKLLTQWWERIVSFKG